MKRLTSPAKIQAFVNAIPINHELAAGIRHTRNTTRSFLIWRQIQADVYGQTVDTTGADEGAALGRALIEHAAACGAWGVITTHLGSLKRVASAVGEGSIAVAFVHQVLSE